MVAADSNEKNQGLPDEPGTGENPEGSTRNADEPRSSERTNEQPVTLEMLQAQLNQANDRVLRAQAELENVRKRARRDMEEQGRYASLPLVADLLPAFDNLDRAVEAAEQNENATGLLEGVKMVAVQIQSILEKYGCRRVPALGDTFDPNVHEAVSQEPSDEVPAGDVTRELRVGYQFHDRIIRPSQVMVSTGSPHQSANE